MRTASLDPRPDADLVVAARDGDGDAFATLFERWFDRCYDVAVRIVVDREVAADVAQDTFVAAHRGLAGLRDPQAFGGWVLRTARNTALTRLARERRSTATDDEQVVRLLDRVDHHDDPAATVTRAEQHDLVWAAAAALGPRDASVLDLHLRHGLDATEIAAALDITPNNAHQVLFRLRSRLGAAVRAWVLWRGGSPRCDDLAAVLAAAAVTSFGAPAVKVIDAHATGCPDCETDRAAVLAPEAMFAAVPPLVAPPALRARARAALEAEGLVPPASSPPATVDGDPRAPRSARRIAAVVVAAAVLVTAVVLLTGEQQPEPEDSATPPVSSTPTPDGDDEGPPDSLSQSATTAAPSTTAGPGIEGSTVPTPTPTTGPTTGPATTPDSVPVGDGGTVPSSIAPTPPDPTTTVPSPSPPTVVAFSATFTGLGPCGSASGRLWELSWVVADATEVVLTGPNVATGPHPATGSAAACSGFGPAPTWQLEATGPGGSATGVTTGT